jgi:hypothetical protein
MTATLNLPKTAALAMLAKAQSGDEMLQILDAVVDTHEDQVPVVNVEVPTVDEMPSDAYIMENDYQDDFDF